MKKLNFAIFGAVMAISLATQAFAETTIPWTKEGCESVKGTWITAHSPDDDGCDAAHCNGRNFCRSTMAMNWWSAAIWCKSIGHKLVSFTNLCPGITPNSGAPCANIRNVNSRVWFWTDMVWNTKQSLGVDSSGSVNADSRSGNGWGYQWLNTAMCEQ